MCDYSLHAVSARPAKLDDKLITAAFVGTSTRGFAAVGEPGVAVCLRPGTEIAFENDIKESGLIQFFRRGRLGKVARFRQINYGNLHAHHDALEFPNVRVVLVTQLREGQRATVLQLPAEPRSASSNEKSKPAAVR
jgi:hypothetical protein